LHEKEDSFESLKNIVNETAKSSGVLLIPSFAVGRAQLLQHMLTTLMSKNEIPRMKIFLDSPMAITVSDIYCKYSAEHRLSEAQCMEMCDAVTYTRNVDESKAIAEETYPHIIIAGSGMATGGRILHHFKRLLGKSNTTVLFAGYQAGGTRGAKMLAGVDTVKIHGDWIPLRAKVRELDTLSGHGDYRDIGEWLKASSLSETTKIHLVHGDPDALEGMRDYIKRETLFPVDIAGYKHILEL
jgi:metallo-beta-lactamase family protein